MNVEKAIKVLREQTVPMLRATGGDGHADAIQALMVDYFQAVDALRLKTMECARRKADQNVLTLSLLKYKEAALRFYRPDGSFEVLASEDLVVQRRKEAAAALGDVGAKLTDALVAAHLAGSAQDGIDAGFKVFGLTRQYGEKGTL